MITFRWLILRLFWSLLLLPLVAYPLLWFLHEVVFAGIYFGDSFLVAILWVLLFAGTSLMLNRLGARRFAMLDEAGREALAKNQGGQIQEVFAWMQKLFFGGLLSRGFQEKIRRRLLRQYFPFYAAHPENEQYREQLLTALRESVRAEESYQILKAYAIRQPALTLPVIDLAEELLEHRPDDNDLLTFLTRQYLQEHATHFRAEHIFAQYLARGGPLVPEILSLCLSRLLRQQRHDDFAVWNYVRAFQSGETENPQIRRRLYEAQQKYKRLGRHETLANVVTSMVADFAQEEIAGWVAEEQVEQKQTVRFRVARAVYRLQQGVLEIYSRLRERRQWVYIVAGAVIVVLTGGFLARSIGIFKTHTVPEVKSEVSDDTTAVYFAVQVSAIRSANAAQREAERLLSRGLEVHVLKPQTSRGWHRIRIGKYRSRQAAQVAADSLKAVGIIRDYFITN